MSFQYTLLCISILAYCHLYKLKKSCIRCRRFSFRSPSLSTMQPAPSIWATDLTCPLLTRWLITVLVLLWLAGLLLGQPPMMFANCPVLITINPLLIGNIFASTFIQRDALSLLFIACSMGQSSAYVERALGSCKLLLLFLLFLVTINISFFFLVNIMYFVLGLHWMRDSCSTGMWPIALAFIAIQSQTTPGETMPLFCFPVQIPKLYYPWIILCIFTLLSGIDIGLILGTVLGFAYVHRRLPIIDRIISDERVCFIFIRRNHMYSCSLHLFLEP